MIRRLFFVGVMVALFVFVLAKAGYISTVIRSGESLVRPVFHKEIINRYAGIYKEDPLFVTALIKVESKFSEKAISRSGAIGLMQIMPKTSHEIAKELKIKKFKESDLENPELNIHFGFHYLSKLRKEFGDHDITVLSAYNAGRKNVRDWLKQKKKSRLDLEDIEFLETRNFVREVTSTYLWLKRYQKLRGRILKIGGK